MAEIGFCSVCGKKTVIVNKRHGLCNNCNRLRLDSQKGKYDGDDNTDNDKKSQISLFNDIWASTEHKCQLTGKSLSDIIPYSTFWFSCFAHILPKGKYPKFKYNIENILLVHPDVHYQLDFGTKESQIKHIGSGGMDKWNKLREELLRVYPK